MRPRTRIEWIGWSLVAVVILSYLTAVGIVRTRSPNFVLLAIMLFSFLPFFVFPTRACFDDRPFLRCVGVGWCTFFLGQVILVFVYSVHYPTYRDFGWGSPEGPEIVAAAFTGFIPGFIITCMAALLRYITIRVRPLRRWLYCYPTIKGMAQVRDEPSTMPPD